MGGPNRGREELDPSLSGDDRNDTGPSDAEARLRLLADCGLVLARAPGQPAAFKEMAALTVPLLADICFVDLLNERGEIIRTAWAHRDADKQAEFDAFWPTVPATSYAKHPAAMMVAEGKSIFEPNVDDDWLKRTATSESHLKLQRGFGIASAIVVPLQSDGTPFGGVTLYLSNRYGRRYTLGDLALAEEIGRRASIVIAQARQTETLRRLNASLESEVAARTAERDRIWLVSDDLMSVAGSDGFLKSINPAWSRVLGYDDAKLLATPFREFGHPQEQAGTDEVMERLSRGETVARYESRMRRADGTYRWISWTVVPEGELFYAIGRDVTARRMAAEELEAANRELLAQIEERERIEETLRQMQRLEAVGQLTSGVAHDFNNLLTVLLGNIELLEKRLQDLDDAKLARRLANMRAAGERGAKLTAQLLAFSRRQRLEPKALNLNQVLSAMGELLGTTLGQSVGIGTNFAPDLWCAFADRTQFELVILNLALNARDAMRSGGGVVIESANVTLGVPVRAEEPAAGMYVAITVSDTGPGMAPEVLAKAFEPFFTTKGPGKGSGLGLSQVLGFAKQSGGGVRIESAPGAGTRVHVYLPRTNEIATELADDTTDKRASPGKCRHILLVDDEAPVRDAIAGLLRELGHEVVEAGSGGAALDALHRHAGIDLALIDFAMPGMNGEELARQIRTRWPSLPVLFVTGLAQSDTLAGIGEEHMVLKPPVKDELARKVQAAPQPR